MGRYGFQSPADLGFVWCWEKWLKFFKPHYSLSVKRDVSVHLKRMRIEQVYVYNGLSRWLGGKESTSNARDMGSIPGSGSSPGGGNGNPLKYSCLGNSMDRGTWWATVGGVAKSRTQLSNWAATTTNVYKTLWYRKEIVNVVSHLLFPSHSHPFGKKIEIE